METMIHCFEAAGLGKAPFVYLGCEYQEISHGERVLGSIGGVAITTRPGGTCQYCGTAIVNLFRIRSSDGNEFIVGSECVLKTGDEGLIKLVLDACKAMMA